MLKKFEIIRPDDWHLHIREGELMKRVLPFTYNHFQRALIMPNLEDPVFTRNQALDYRKKIYNCLPKSSTFKPLLTLYLNKYLDFEDIKNAFDEKIIFALKYYPKGATTNSKSGINDVKEIMNILEKMCINNIPLCIHGESNDKEIDVFDREKYFLENQLQFIINELPELRVTLEHVTTSEAVSYILESSPNLKATITLHHLLINRNDMFLDGLRPHYFCLPVAKREEHRKELLKVALSGNENFFLGTDSAPHVKEKKLSECGCAGIFSSPVTIQTLIQLFENFDCLENLEKFVSLNGANHYGQKVNDEKVKFIKANKPLNFIKEVIVSDTSIKVFEPKFKVFWQKQE